MPQSLLASKGAMSEQELRWLSLRLAGGRLNKARRGESYVTPPTGYLWGGGGLELDPDESVQRAVKLVFERFSVEPSARAVLRWALATGFLMPTRDRATSELRWRPLENVRLNGMLRNPAYAGVYVFGRHPVRTVLVDGQIRKVRTRIDDPSEWPVRIDKAHPAYISWETCVKNGEKLPQNTTQAGGATRGAPREGSALLVGVAICGRCGRRMSARYESRSQRWSYACWGESSSGEKLCWSVAGLPIDRAVEKSFLETMVPDEIDLSLAVDREVEKQADSLDSAWRARIEQALGLVIEAVALHPIDVPRRTTRIRVQWHGGAVSEIEIGRPSRGQYRARAPEVVPRIRELATAGLDDDEIARRLRDDGLRSGSGLPWSADRVVSARRRHRISRVTDRPRNPPLPERHPDGRYSVPGAAARFGVSHNVVRAWIEASRCAAAWVRS